MFNPDTAVRCYVTALRVIGEGAGEEDTNNP